MEGETELSVKSGREGGHSGTEVRLQGKDVLTIVDLCFLGEGGNGHNVRTKLNRVFLGEGERNAKNGAVHLYTDSQSAGGSRKEGVQFRSCSCE